MIHVFFQLLLIVFIQLWNMLALNNDFVIDEQVDPVAEIKISNNMRCNVLLHYHIITQIIPQVAHQSLLSTSFGLHAMLPAQQVCLIHYHLDNVVPSCLCNTSDDYVQPEPYSWFKQSMMTMYNMSHIHNSNKALVGSNCFPGCRV